MKKALAFVLLTSVLLRLWVALGYWSDKPLTQDAKEYLELATNFNKTGSLQYDEHHTLQIESYGRAPGYPFWLSMVLRVQPTIAWLRVVEVMINLVSTWLFFLVARELFGFRPGISAFILSTFYVPFLSLIPAVLSENLWICVMLVSYLYLIRTRTRPQQSPGWNRLVSIVFLAAATLIRPGAVFLLPFYAWWIFQFSGWKRAVIACAIYFALLTPWNLHLYRQEGHFIFVASEGGVTFWTGTHPNYSGDGDLSVNPAVQKQYRDILRSHEGEPPVQKEKFFYTDGLANILSSPGTYVWIEARKLLFGALPFGASVMQTSLLHRITGIGCYLLLLVLALVAFPKASVEARYLLIGVSVSYAMMILLFFPQERFRIALIDPLLLLFAASELSRRLKNV